MQHDNSSASLLQNCLLCPALSRLGKKQKQVLSILAKGGAIRFFKHYSEMWEKATVIDEDDNEIEYCPPSLLISLNKRDLVYPKKIYSTVQPDTDTYDYLLRREYLEAVKGWA